MRIERYITIGFIVVGLLYLTNTILTYRNNQDIIRAGEELSNSNRVLFQLESLKREIISIQSYTRAYIITADPEFSAITSTTLDSAYKHANALRQLFKDEPLQLVLLDSALTMSQQTTQGNLYIRKLVKEGKKEEAVKFVKTGVVVTATKQIEALIDKIKEQEEVSITESQLVLKHEETTFFITYFMRIILVPAVLLTLYFLINRGFRALHKTQARLTETANLLSGLIENAPVAITVRDVEGNIILANDELLKSFGVTAEQVKGKKISDFLSPEDAKRIHLKDVALLDSNIKREAENVVTANGTTQTIYSVSFPTRDGNGKINYICNIGINITDRKNKEELIRKMNEELEQKIKTITDYKYALDESAIVAVTDHTGKIIHVNNNFCKISKYNAEELLGQDHRLLSSGFHSKQFIKNLWSTIAKGKVWRGEMKNKAKDGTYYWVDTTIVPFINLVGKPFQYLAIRSDITERKLNEESIMHLNSLLGEKISDLKEVNKEMEIFTYSVAHDMRTPLRAISAFSNLLQQDYSANVSDEGKRLLAVLDDNAQNMGKLIDSLLRYATIGQTALTYAPTDITALASKVAHELKVAHTDIKADISFGEHITMNCDPVLIKQVLQNLFGNALKYSARVAAPKIEFSGSKHNGEAVFFVKDNGAGFDMKYSEKLFSPFQRLHPDDSFEGTGIGLTIVQRIIQKHGGRVWAEGKINQGATFYFSLPDKNI